MDDTVQYVPSPGQPCEAKRTGHTWGQACIPGPDDQPHHGTPLEQPLCIAGKTSWKRVSSDSLGLALQYRMPFLSRRWFHSYKNWLNLGGSVCLDCHHPRVPSHSLEMTKLRVGSVCWAWCQSSKVIQATCWLPCTCIQNMQITTVCLYGTYEAFEGTLMHSSHCCSCNLEVSTWVVRHTSWLGHPQ